MDRNFFCRSSSLTLCIVLVLTLSRTTSAVRADHLARCAYRNGVTCEECSESKDEELACLSLASQKGSRDLALLAGATRSAALDKRVLSSCQRATAERTDYGGWYCNSFKDWFYNEDNPSENTCQGGCSCNGSSRTVTRTAGMETVARRNAENACGDQNDNDECSSGCGCGACASSVRSTSCRSIANGFSCTANCRQDGSTTACT